jgi:single-strand DNA-binding protein
MAGVNKVIIIGRLGADPEVKTIAGGQVVCRLNVATSENWTAKDGTRQEKTEWHRISVWGRQGENCGKYLTKGRQVYVEGRLQTRSWEDQQGQKKYATEIVATQVQFIGGNGGEQRASSGPSGGGDEANFQDFGPEPSFNPDEEIPF